MEFDEATQPVRRDGYAPLRDYAAIGDGRTVGLVALDGAIDWLPLPDLDSPTVFAAIVDAERGGRFTLQPEGAFATTRRYLTDTNVLETTFVTDAGSVAVTDALTLPDDALVPYRELQRKIVGLSGAVRMVWRLEPRFGYADWPQRITLRAGVPIVSAKGDAIAVQCFSAGDPAIGERSIDGRFEAVAGSSALLALSFAHKEPLVLPSRDELAARLEATAAAWQRWTSNRVYDGPWRGEVLRSALALKLLVYAPSGAIAAAASTSLPEQIGGERNWDYRYAWVRDSAFTVNAFLRLGCPSEANAYFWWLMHATQLTHPRLQVLYRLDGGTRIDERDLAFSGYRDSTPVRVGNRAVDQLQLDTYGELMQTAWLYGEAGNPLDRDVARRLAGIADFVGDNWRQPDAGIWEVRSEPAHFTQSKMHCAVALARACGLAGQGVLRTSNARSWDRESVAIREYVDSRCWSEAQQSYARFAGSDELDASLLLGVLHDYASPDDERMGKTVDAIARELAEGPYVRRYTGEDGLAGEEGAFLACSFWLAEAWARTGRVEAAAEHLEQVIALANDVGLYAEEVAPATGAFLGNMPQGLSHLALISAAAVVAEAAT